MKCWLQYSSLIATANLLDSSFKIQAHAMFLDTSFNSLSSVLSNIYQSFIEAAIKLYHYVKCLPSSKQPHSPLLISKFFIVNKQPAFVEACLVEPKYG